MTDVTSTVVGNYEQKTIEFLLQWRGRYIHEQQNEFQMPHQTSTYFTKKKTNCSHLGILIRLPLSERSHFLLAKKSSRQQLCLGNVGIWTLNIHWFFSRLHELYCATFKFKNSIIHHPCSVFFFFSTVLFGRGYSSAECIHLIQKKTFKISIWKRLCHQQL